MLNDLLSIFAPQLIHGFLKLAGFFIAHIPQPQLSDGLTDAAYTNTDQAHSLIGLAHRSQQVESSFFDFLFLVGAVL